MISVILVVLVGCKKEVFVEPGTTNEEQRLTVEERFKIKIDKLNGGKGELPLEASILTIDLESMATHIAEGMFSVDEVLYWLDERRLTDSEKLKLKNGEVLMDSDRNACFYFLGKSTPKKALKYYYNNIMDAAMLEQEGSMAEIDESWIPEAQTKWCDQFLESILHGWKLSDPNTSKEWLDVMSAQYELSYP
jgi:hypothetical protein